MTTDEFVQNCQRHGLTEDQAWLAYPKAGGVTRDEFASLWLFWRSPLGRAVEANPEIVEPKP